MTEDDPHELIEAARVRAGLTVSELWLRYLGLGGSADLFDVDGYLAGLLPLSAFDQNALAVAVNERLEEIYRDARVTLPRPPLDLPPVGAPGDVIGSLLGPVGEDLNVRLEPPPGASPPRDPPPSTADDTDIP